MSLFEPLHVKLARDRKNQKGQVALFVALIFQILFVFFAAVVNVGLLVHQKINLQNSVDIAAYYAGMKQAENLNAIAHINYQIRQSWKLLTWRFRVIGTGGASPLLHPYNIIPNGGQMGDARNNVLVVPGYEKWLNMPDFCSNYPPWKPKASPDENLCKEPVSIPALKPPRYLGGFGNISRAVINLTNIYAQQAGRACEYAGSDNYYLLAQFAVAFKFDQMVRKGMISHISHATTLKEDDLLDLDGESVKAGALKTLKANLTGPNRASVDMKFLNGLSNSECDHTQDPNRASKFLNEIVVMPSFQYRDFLCNVGPDLIAPKIRELTKDPDDLPAAYVSGSASIARIRPAIDYLKEFTGALGPPPENYSVGFEKNPFCVAYVGIKATAKPKIAFLPFGTVTLTATAFVKPFGGKIGPWYFSKWPRGGKSSGGPKIDPLLPTRIEDVSNAAAADPNDESRGPNHSRYPGDLHGMKARNILGYYSEALHNLSDQWRTRQPVTVGNYSDAPNYNDYIEAWNGGPYEGDQGPGDPMAWNVADNKESSMRKLEMLAILPDLFDLSYYSIEPDFYNNYLVRMRAGLFAGVKEGLNPPRTGTRGDLGSRNNNPEFKDFNMLKQPLYAKDIVDKLGMANTLTNFLPHMLNPLRMPAKDIYVEKNPVYDALNGFLAKSQIDFSLDSSRYARCKVPATATEPNPGGCVSGGRTGYSVKLVSYDWLMGTHNLGDPASGDANGSDELLNKPAKSLGDEW